MMTHEELRRDPALPARAGDAELSLPDEGRVVQAVARHLVERGGPRPRAARCVYARWKPGVSLTATFRVAFDDDVSRLVTWKRYLDDKAERVEAAYEPDEYAQEAARPLRAVAVDAERGLTLHAFPADRVLDGAARVLTMKRTAHLVDRSGILAPWVVRERASGLEVVRYKPERRVVVRLDLKLRGEDGARDERRLGARVLGPEHAARAAQRRRAVFTSADAPPAPPLLWLDERPGILLEEWLELESAPRPLERQLRQGGELLARLHTLPMTEAGVARGAPRGPLEPLLAVDAELARAARRVPPPPELPARSWVHGDLHLEQIGTRRDGGAVLLDLDELRPGHAVEDLASALADELARAPETRLDTLRGPLLAGYPTRPEGLEAWVADGLVWRAAAAVRRLEEGAVERARGLVARALELVERRR